MANKKFSELPTGAVSGTDTLAVVKAGVSTAVPFTHTHPESDITSLVSDLASLQSQTTGKLTRLFETTTTVGNSASLLEEDLHTFTVPAGKLVKTGDAIRARTWVQCAGNNNSKRVRVYFGAMTVGDSTAQNFNNVGFIIETLVFRTGAATQKALISVLQPNVNAAWSIAAGGGLNTSAPTETLSGTVTIRITGQSVNVGAANDVSALATVVDYLPAA